MIDEVVWSIVRAGCRGLARSRLHLTVHGAEHVPATGPVLLVCRHYHYAYDGVALIAAVPRPVQIVVALDWTPNRALRRCMEGACGLLHWPSVVRRRTGDPDPPAFSRAEAQRTNRRASLDLVHALANGEVVAIFPEAYPNVDPVYTPKNGQEMGRFRPGFARAATLAARRREITVVPVGLRYDGSRRNRVTLRVGQPRPITASMDAGAIAGEVERDVRELSGLVPDDAAAAERHAVR